MVNEVKVANKTISGLCYELYKNDWMRRISSERRADALKNWYQETELKNRSVFGPEQYIERQGYDGELYVCFEEFLDSEYQDSGYMKELLSNDELFAEYEADRSFVCEYDCTDVSDSLLISSGTEIASMKYKGSEAVIEVRGEVKIAFNPHGIGHGADDIYRDVHEMPDELKEIISSRAFDDERIFFDENNWFELFYKDHCEVIDCENLSPEELKELMFDIVTQYEKDEEGFDEYRAQKMLAAQEAV